MAVDLERRRSEKVDREQRGDGLQAAVRSAPGRDRAEAGLIEALEGNATRKRRNAVNSRQLAA